MFTHSIKQLLTICAIASFLSACSSTASKHDHSGSDHGHSHHDNVAVSGGTGKVDVSETTAVVPTGNVLYFDFDSAALRADSRELLVAHAAVLRAQPRAVRLEGHADERGTREYNMALGERRAQSVYDYLRSLGVRSSVEVVSYGEEKPAVAGSNEQSLQQNRRVEIK